MKSRVPCITLRAKAPSIFLDRSRGLCSQDSPAYDLFQEWRVILQPSPRSLLKQSSFCLFFSLHWWVPCCLCLLGTGKTLTGVEVACQFVALNRREGTGGQVLFCAPSNHAVDVAASGCLFSKNYNWEQMPAITYCGVEDLRCIGLRS